MSNLKVFQYVVIEQRPDEDVKEPKILVHATTILALDMNHAHNKILEKTPKGLEPFDIIIHEWN